MNPYPALTGTEGALKADPAHPAPLPTCENRRGSAGSRAHVKGFSAIKDLWLVAGASALMAGHYWFGEWVWHPKVKVWLEGRFWADLPLYAGVLPVLWVCWWVVSLGRLKGGSLLAGMAAWLCAGDVIWWLAAFNFKALERALPLDYWWWWTYCFPAALIAGNAALARRGWRIWKSEFCSFRRARGADHPPAVRANPFLKAAAILACGGALVLSALHLIPLRMEMNQGTVKIAQEALLPEELQDDFAFLCGETVWRGKRLGALLAHVELAALQRTQFYTNLDAALYRPYLLSPKVDDLSLQEIDWRRPFWEHFYPRVRNMHDPLPAAAVVVRALRERVGVSSDYPYRVGVETIWTQGMTDARGFARVYVAALRSTGIAARLSAQGSAEVWTGDAWREAPRTIAGFPGKNGND